MNTKEICDDCIYHLYRKGNLRLNDIPGKTIQEQILFARKCSTCLIYDISILDPKKCENGVQK